MTSTVMHALVIVFVVAFVRALPWPQWWKAQKPLACNACMVGWSVITGAALSYARDGANPLTFVPAAGLAWVVLEVISQRSGPEVPPPPL